MTHPGAEALATFVDGTADAATRAEVAAHIESCDDCLFVVGETSRLGDEEGAATGQWRRRRRYWPLLAAAIFILICASAWLLRDNFFDPVRQLSHASRAIQSRPVEGRIDGFDYAPFRRTRRAAPATDPALMALVVVAAEVRERNAAATNDARRQHAAGIAALVAGDTRGALPLLRRATTLSPRSSRYWNDLAVALHEAASDSEAMAAAERALFLDPRSDAAQFNRAVIAESLGHGDEAAAAYRDYAARDHNTRWASEAATRRDRLGR